MPKDEEGELLVVLLDVQLFRRGGDSAPPENIVQQLLLFLKLQLLMNERNQLAVYAVAPGASPLLYSSHANGSEPGAEQQLGLTLLERMQVLLRAADANAGAEQAVAGALSRALCYIHRWSGGAGAGAAATAAAAAAGTRPGGGAAAAGAAQRPRPRILCVLGCPDVAVQYVPIMNAIFAAQMSGVVVDGVALTDEDSPFLQQAAHITGGVYVRPRDAGALLEYLATSFGADTHTRAMLAQHHTVGVDYRASCFCHKSIIDTGWVCSVCLSIFCSRAGKAQCPTCGTAFKKAG